MRLARFQNIYCVLCQVAVQFSRLVDQIRYGFERGYTYILYRTAILILHIRFSELKVAPLGMKHESKNPD